MYIYIWMCFFLPFFSSFWLFCVLSADRQIYSFNEANANEWPAGLQTYVQKLKTVNWWCKALRVSRKTGGGKEGRRDLTVSNLFRRIWIMTAWKLKHCCTPTQASDTTRWYLICVCRSKWGSRCGYTTVMRLRVNCIGRVHSGTWNWRSMLYLVSRVVRGHGSLELLSQAFFRCHYLNPIL